jgi:class 3 adenylate cyclase
MPDSSSPKEPPEDFINQLKAARASRSSKGERRIVTILFCDVVGSTSMAEQLDPEDWADFVGLGRSQEGYDTIVSAYREARDQNSRRSLWSILVTLAEIESKRGQPARAEAMLVQARKVIAYLARHIGNQKLLKAFLALPQVRAVAPDQQQ